MTTGRPLVEWSAQFETGLSDLDGQHQRLFGIINQLSGLQQQGATVEQLCTSLDDLFNYTLYHFQHEADLMQQYPVSDDLRHTHLNAHQAFLDRLVSARELAATSPAVVVEQLLAFLVKWLVHHVTTVDVRMAREILRLSSGTAPPQVDSVDAHDQLLNETISDLYDRIGKRTFETLEVNRQLQLEVARREMVEHALSRSKERFRSLYQHAPVALCEENWSQVKQRLHQMQASGVTDLRAYLQGHPEEVRRCGALIETLNANQAMLALAGVHSKEELHASRTLLCDDLALIGFTDQLAAMAKGTQLHDVDSVLIRADGAKRQVVISLFVMPGREEDLDLVIVAILDITERKNAEAALRASEERWSFALEGARDGVWDWDVEAGLILFSRRGKEMYGLEEDDTVVSRTDWTRRIHPEDLERLKAEIQAHLSGQNTNYASEYRVQCADESWKWILERGMVVRRDAAGEPLRMIGTHTDISERRAREDALRLSATVLNTVSEAVMLTDADNLIIDANPAFTAITGYALEEVIGKNPRVLSSGRHPQTFYNELWGELYSRGMWRGEVWNRNKKGEVYVEWLSLKLVFDEKGRITHHVAVFSDISERKAAEMRVHHLAHHDTLTDLPNRTLFADRLQQALSIARRTNTRVGLIYLDLDKFKPVNDQLGHHVGDQLLQEVARSLLKCVRKSDTVSRMGGDEFVVLLPDIEVYRDAVIVAEKIRTMLNQPFELSGRSLSISCSIGIVVFPEHGQDGSELIRNADTAMYQAKKIGGSSIVSFGDVP